MATSALAPTNPTLVAAQAPSSTFISARGWLLMDLGSCSRHSWADEVEAKEASHSAGRSFPYELPSLAAAAHAALVL